MRVSVVVLNFNGGDLVQSAIVSALAQQDVEVEVVVVDNGSADGSLAEVRRLFEGDPRVSILPMGRNLGFAAGMNAGMAVTTGEVVVPLNCDAQLHPDFARAAIEVLRQSSDIGAVAPLVLRVDQRGPDWNAAQGRIDCGPQRITRSMRVVPVDRIDRAEDVTKASGACPAYRRTALDEVMATFGVGPFDPWFVTYGEDIDLAMKLGRLGWRHRYEPAVRAAHVGGWSSGHGVLAKRGQIRTLLVRARWINALRHGRGLGLLTGLCAIALGDLALVALGLVRGDLSAPRDVARAWLDVARAAPAALRFRWVHRARPASRTSAGIVGRRPESPLLALPALPPRP